MRGRRNSGRFSFLCVLLLSLRQLTKINHGRKRFGKALLHLTKLLVMLRDNLGLDVILAPANVKLLAIVIGADELFANALGRTVQHAAQKDAKGRSLWNRDDARLEGGNVTVRHGRRHVFHGRVRC